MNLKSKTDTIMTVKDFSRPTVLIVEPNPYHGEILPGFTHLFQSIGYDVHLLIRDEVIEENPFVVYPEDKLPVIHCANRDAMKQVLASKAIDKYDLVFFSTNVDWEPGVEQTGYVRQLGFLPEGKYGCLFVEHNLLFLNEDDSALLELKGRVFTLLEYDLAGRSTKMLNPHYFGKTVSRETRTGVTSILVMGSSSRDPNNLEELFMAVRRVKSDVSQKIKISILGSDLYIPSDLRDCIEVLGRLGFEDYYKSVGNHDYLLTLIDLSSDDIIHTKYSRGTTTGTIQASLGFTKPMIIDQVHARSYGFTSEEAIIFERDELADGIKRALIMSDGEYTGLIHRLEEKSKHITNLSLRNLVESIDNLKNDPIHIPSNIDLMEFLSSNTVEWRKEKEEVLKRRVFKEALRKVIKYLRNKL